MGRRGSRRRRKAKKNNKSQQQVVSKKRFKKDFCRSCGICVGGFKPKFCYTFMYQDDPDAFNKLVFPRLIQHKKKLKELRNLVPIDNLASIDTFISTFCGTGICDIHNCPVDNKEVKACLKIFVQQTKGNLNRSVGGFKAPKRPKVEPTMSVIISDNDAFEKEVLKILENYNKQHDKVGTS